MYNIISNIDKVFNNLSEKEVLMRKTDLRKDIVEAIQACDNVLYHLNETKEQLIILRKWRVTDIFGWGFFTFSVKKEKINTAKNELEVAKENMQLLKKELFDIAKYGNILVATESLIEFMDQFFDVDFKNFSYLTRDENFKANLDQAIIKIEFIKEKLYKL